MIPSALSKSVVLGLAMVAIGAIDVVAAGLTANASQRFVTLPDQVVNGASKTDRLASPDVGSTVVRSDKTSRRHRSPKSEVEFKFEPTSTPKTGPTGSVPPKKEAVTPGTVDDVARPVVRANDDPGAVVEPAANAKETSRNFAEEPAEREPLSWSAWSYSKGLVDRTDRRARFLWNRLVDR